MNPELRKQLIESLLAEKRNGADYSLLLRKLYVYDIGKDETREVILEVGRLFLEEVEKSRADFVKRKDQLIGGAMVALGTVMFCGFLIQMAYFEDLRWAFLKLLVPFALITIGSWRIRKAVKGETSNTGVVKLPGLLRSI